MKKRLVIISGLVAGALILLLTLNATIEHPNEHRNGFARNFLRKDAVKVAAINYPADNVTSICGEADGSIYFDSKQPGELFFTDKNFTGLKNITIPLPSIKYLAPLFFTTIEYPNIYILGGNVRKSIVADLRTQEFKIHDTHTTSFNKGVSISGNSFIVRDIDTPTLNLLFSKANYDNDNVQRENNLSEKLNDAGFTHDGMLDYDKGTHRLIYVDFYSNHITCFDTNLNLLYRATTIDTTNLSNAKPGKKGTSVTNSKPPIMANYFISVSNGLLYVISKLKADNEDGQAFEYNSVIDKYSITDGSYRGSFYLLSVNKNKLKSFKVFNNTCVILYEGQVIKYRI